MNKLATVLGGLLFLSLAGNIFMGALMLGDRASQEVSKPSDDRRAEWRKRDEQLMKRLSEPDRVILKEVKGKYEAEMEVRRTELEAVREKLEAAHAADPVDSIAIEKAGREEALKKAALLKTVRAARKEISGRLSPEGRAEMEKMRPPKGRSERGDRRPRDGNDHTRRDDVPAQNYDQSPKPHAGDCGGCEVPGGVPLETPPAQP